MMQFLAGIYGIALGCGMGYAAIAAVFALQGQSVSALDWLYIKATQIAAGAFLGGFSALFLIKGYALLFDMAKFIHSPAWLDY